VWPHLFALLPVEHLTANGSYTAAMMAERSAHGPER
jgi:hypothetical protein